MAPKLDKRAPIIASVGLTLVISFVLLIFVMGNRMDAKTAIKIQESGMVIEIKPVCKQMYLRMLEKKPTTSGMTCECTEFPTKKPLETDTPFLTPKPIDEATTAPVENLNESPQTVLIKLTAKDTKLQTVQP